MSGSTVVAAFTSGDIWIGRSRACIIEVVTRIHTPPYQYCRTAPVLNLARAARSSRASRAQGFSTPGDAASEMDQRSLTLYPENLSSTLHLTVLHRVGSLEGPAPAAFYHSEEALQTIAESAVEVKAGGRQLSRITRWHMKQPKSREATIMR